MDDLISRKMVLTLPRNKVRSLRTHEVIEETINVTDIEHLPFAQPEQAAKDCRNCKYGKYNDHWKTHFCYNPNECTEWNLWEPSAQPDITSESAIDYLHKIGWMQEHDKILTESAQPEIIQCKDCSHYSVCADDYMCGLNVLAYVKEDDFCSRAERREE